MASRIVRKTIFAATATSPTTFASGFRSLRPFSCGVLANLMTTDPSHSIVKLESTFGSSSPRVGNGVLVHPRIIVTSAHVVGRVAGSDCELGRTVATTWIGRVLRTRALAVNLGGDVAVLHMAGDDVSIPPPTLLAHAVGDKESPLMLVTRHESCRGRLIVEMKVRAAEDTSPRSEWVHPVGDDFGWARYGARQGEEEEHSVYPGSPWLNAVSEVVGIVSWAVGKEPYGCPGNFVVPPPRIRAALDYAAKRRAQDRVVMDKWIEKVTTVADGCDDPVIAEGYVEPFPFDFLMTMYLDLPI